MERLVTLSRRPVVPARRRPARHRRWSAGDWWGSVMIVGSVIALAAMISFAIAHDLASGQLPAVESVFTACR